MRFRGVLGVWRYKPVSPKSEKSGVNAAKLKTLLGVYKQINHL
jgi:hypothetical protein